jgi:hypothetical protein
LSFKSITKFVVTDSTSLEGNSTKATDYTTQTSGVNHIWNKIHVSRNEFKIHLSLKSITKFVVTDTTSLEGNSTKATDYTTQTSGVNHIWPMQRRIIPNLSEDIPYIYFKRVTAVWKVRNGL